jgi:hypothetical protein
MPGMSHLFVPGPTNIPESIRKAIDIPMEDHRAPDMPEFTLPLFADLKSVFKTVAGSVFFLLPRVPEAGKPGLPIHSVPATRCWSRGLVSSRIFGLKCVSCLVWMCRWSSAIEAQGFL